MKRIVKRLIHWFGCRPANPHWGWDGASFHSTCGYCGKDIMRDSQGGWF